MHGGGQGFDSPAVHQPVYAQKEGGIATAAEVNTLPLEAVNLPRLRTRAARPTPPASPSVEAMAAMFAQLVLAQAARLKHVPKDGWATPRQPGAESMDLGLHTEPTPDDPPEPVSPAPRRPAAQSVTYAETAPRGRPWRSTGSPE